MIELVLPGLDEAASLPWELRPRARSRSKVTRPVRGTLRTVGDTSKVLAR